MSRPICKHDWNSIESPSDAYTPWFKCSKCDIIGRATRSSWGKINIKKIKPYKCSIQKCRKYAIKQISGRDSRFGYLWRCEDHVE